MHDSRTLMPKAEGSKKAISLIKKAPKRAGKSNVQAHMASKSQRANGTTRDALQAEASKPGSMSNDSRIVTTVWTETESDGSKVLRTTGGRPSPPESQSTRAEMEG